jgi:hypothetical protein
LAVKICQSKSRVAKPPVLTAKVIWRIDRSDRYEYYSAENYLEETVDLGTDRPGRNNNIFNYMQ